MNLKDGNFENILKYEINKLQQDFLYKHHLQNYQNYLYDPQMQLLFSSFGYLSANIKEQIDNYHPQFLEEISSIVFGNYNPFVIPKISILKINNEKNKSKDFQVIDNDNTFSLYVNKEVFTFSVLKESIISPFFIINCQYTNNNEIVFTIKSDKPFEKITNDISLEFFINSQDSFNILHSVVSSKEPVKVFYTKDYYEYSTVKWNPFSKNIYQNNSSYFFFRNFIEIKESMLFFSIDISANFFQLSKKYQNIKEDNNKKDNNILYITISLNNTEKIINEILKDTFLLNCLFLTNLNKNISTGINIENIETEFAVNHITEQWNNTFFIESVFFFHDKRKNYLKNILSKNINDILQDKIFFKDIHYSIIFKNTKPYIKFPVNKENFSLFSNTILFCDILQVEKKDLPLFFDRANTKITTQTPLVCDENIDIIYISNNKNIQIKFFYLLLNQVRLNGFNIESLIFLWKSLFLLYNDQSIFNMMTQYKTSEVVSYVYYNLSPVQSLGYEVTLYFNNMNMNILLYEIYGFFFFLHFYIDINSFIIIKFFCNGKEVIIDHQINSLQKGSMSNVF
jgi:hypothetical protein